VERGVSRVRFHESGEILQSGEVLRSGEIEVFQGGSSWAEGLNGLGFWTNGMSEMGQSGESHLGRVNPVG
jgi:hypothetical protein